MKIIFIPSYTRLRWGNGKRKKPNGVEKTESPFHWTGVAVLSRNSALDQSTYEGSSMRTLQQVDNTIAKNCTIFSDERQIQSFFNSKVRTFHTGYYNPFGGWIESGKVLELMFEDAKKAGVICINQNCVAIKDQGIILKDGSFLQSNFILVCCGAWTPFLLPETSKILTPTGQPVFLFRNKDTISPKDVLGKGEGGNMCPITFDIAQTGFYMFPYHESTRLLKVGHHGTGFKIEKPATPEYLRNLEQTVQDKELKRFINFLDEIFPDFSSEWFPEKFRICQYCDSIDSHFLIDQVRPGVFVASGGSGHGFKFGLVVGELIVDLVEGVENKNSVMREAARRFRFRSTGAVSYEKARTITANTFVNEAKL